MNHLPWEIGCFNEARECSRGIQMSLFVVVSKEALLMERPKSQVSNKYGWKRISLIVLLFTLHLELVSHTHGTLIVVVHIIW